MSLQASRYNGGNSWLRTSLIVDFHIQEDNEDLPSWLEGFKELKLEKGDILLRTLNSFYYLKAIITFKGFKNSCIILLCMFLYAAIYNYIFKIDKINAMFLNDYIAPIVSFIKPFWLYRIILVSTMLFIMYLMYLPFSKKNHFFRKIINKEISL